ncbi:MAG TPA: NAD(+)/NADH kinase [Oceanobacillus sp.]|nr:NAD(+)/NADH kinase [Oceanobacillus sp.]
MTTLKRLGVLAHPVRPQTAPVADHIAATLKARGLDVWSFADWEEDQVLPHLAKTDMVIAIGGDGAMLRAGRVCAQSEVPVLGVNMGHLGFLTEVQDLSAWVETLDTVLSGDYWIEQRMMIRATGWRDGAQLFAADALNDVVISRGTVMGIIQVDTYVDGDWTTTYNADALVISTATGSTAYALASGGPILPPELRNILLVPVAPHLSLDRPIVLPEGATVEVVVTEDVRTQTVVAADGAALGELLAHDRVRVTASERVCRFVRLRERNYFYRSLLDRLEPRIPVAPRRDEVG